MSEKWTLRAILDADPVEALEFDDLSDWFNPFLPHFVREALRCGGEVRVAERDGKVYGLYLLSPGERIASVLTRDRGIAEEFYGHRGPGPMYSPIALDPSAERFLIYSLNAQHWEQVAPLRWPIRTAGLADLPRVAALLHEEYGEVDERWIATAPAESERCFVAEIDRALVGLGWASIVGRHGRVHSLLVRAPYRGLGIGQDLLRARLLWLRAAGAEEVLSEIAEQNHASRRVAERLGMARVGEMYRLDREGTKAGDARGPR